MGNYASEEYNECKQWIADKIKQGSDWEEVSRLPEEEFYKLQNEDLIIPPDMDFVEWSDMVKTIHANYSQISITELFGLSDGDRNKLRVPIDFGSAWVRYKRYLLGKYDGKPKMSSNAVVMIENNCYWMLNHLKRETRSTGPVKGLVMGSVQSGKTANMIGLVTMAADYDWNVFIILSGTIEVLRKQTRNRFSNDLSKSGGLSWHVLDYTRNPNHMIDIDTGDVYSLDSLSLNDFQEGSPQKNKWLHRYVFVCLKNSKRLKSLISWLHAQKRAVKMRVVVIDDEADQASINTVKMEDAKNEDEIERTAVNRLIIDLVNGSDCEGNKATTQFQAMNYVSFTATPYANVLNEAYRDSLYPKNFICSLPESKEYFGIKAIWGSKIDEHYSGLNIVRTIDNSEMEGIKGLHNGSVSTLPSEMQKSIAWFLCAAAILRERGYKKPISMLIHTTGFQNGHFEEYDLLQEWFERESATGKILELCKSTYEYEKDEFRLKDLEEGYSEYELLNEVSDEFPEFKDIKDDIELLIRNVVNIGLGDSGQFIYQENGIHLCVDNCKANSVAEEDTYLRIVYPDEKELSNMKKAPVFMVMGGNTLSRGLTLEGLVCTYFARNVNHADTLMQMARWFGYKRGYELLQRIWLPIHVQQKFQQMEEIDERLKEEFEDFMEKGKSPSEFGPRIVSASKIARFLLTSKNKSQNMIPCDLDFSGDSYEITQYENNDIELERNIRVTEEFLEGIGDAKKSDAIESAYYWDGVDSDYILNEFIAKYKIFDCSSLHEDIPIFTKWMGQMNEDGKYLKWNVAVAGDEKAKSRWTVRNADVGKIERSRLKKYDYIDIGSLRSGRDILSDICVESLSEEKKKIFSDGKRSGKNLKRLKYELGYSDIPLLLLYRIDHEKGNENKYRTKIGTNQDIIGFSIVIAGQEEYSDYIRTVQVKMPN